VQYFIVYLFVGYLVKLFLKSTLILHVLISDYMYVHCHDMVR